LIPTSDPTPSPEGIYLDYQASTPVDPEVLEAMLPWWRHCGTGNPHSHEHAFGWRAAKAIDDARSRIAMLIGAEGEDVIFTSGATESNNIAILGTMRARETGRRVFLSTAIEHASVLGPAEALTGEGIHCVALPVDSYGRLQREAFLKRLTTDVRLVSIGAANNEIGTLQDLPWIAERCHEVGALLHTDAAQALSAVPLSVGEWGVDFASFSAHKAYGPQGVGALYIAPGLARRLHAHSFGGGQQFGVRPGTLSTALCVGFGTACEILTRRGHIERELVARLRDHFLYSLLEAIPEAALNGPSEGRHPGNLNLRIPNVDAADLIQHLQPTVALSSGSACHSGSDQPSHVLRAIGLTDAAARGSLRLGIGRFTTAMQVDEATKVIVAAFRSLIPLPAEIRTLRAAAI